MEVDPFIVGAHHEADLVEELSRGLDPLPAGGRLPCW